MKPISRSQFSTLLSFLALLAAGSLGLAANAAAITWTAPAGIAGTNDVATNGTGLYAYDWTGTNQTVNGVTFTGVITVGGAGANLGLSPSTGSIIDNSNAFNSGSSPFSALPAAYRGILTGADYAGAAAATVTVTLSNLLTGFTYSVQVWVNDPRGSNNTRTETASGGGNNVTLDYSTGTGSTAGYPGQYTIGTFTATGKTQSFTLLGAASTQLNALQVRLTGVATNYWGGFVNGSWDNTTTNWGPGVSFATLTNAYASVSFADVSSLLTPVVNSNLTVQAGGVTAGAVNFLNNSVAYTLQNAGGDSNGITGASSLAVNGGGSVTLAGPNTYTGVTAINSGTLILAAAGALPPASTISFNQSAAATLNLTGTALSVTNLVFTNTLSETVVITGTNGSSLTVSPPVLAVQPYYETNSLTLNLSGLSAFTYANAAGTILINNGVVDEATSGQTNTVTLAGGVNTITAGTFDVANNNTSSGVVNSTVNLGSSNVFKVGIINLGSGRDGGTIQFAGGLTNPVLAITGTAGGSSTANLSFGGHDSFQLSDRVTDLFDVSAGTLNAQLGGITVGNETPAGNVSGRGMTVTSAFRMGAGTLTAATLVLGNIANASNATNYTIAVTALFSVANGGTAGIGTITMAADNLVNPVASTDHLTNSATLSLTNGGSLLATTIQTGNSASTFTATNNLVLGGGNLGNLSPNGLTVTNVNVILSGLTNAFGISAGQTGTVYSVISGPGSLAAAGPGELVLAGANTYTGSTLVTNGTLQLGPNASLASTAIILGSNGTFDVSLPDSGVFFLNSGQSLIGSGTVNGSIWDQAGAPLIPGGTGAAGTLTINDNLALNGQPLTFDLSPSPASGDDLINVGNTLTLYGNTTVFINPLAGLGTLAAGTYTLMTYSSINTNGGAFILSGARNETLNVGPYSLTLVVGTGGDANLTWVGDGTSDNWDVQTTNWLNGGSPDVFYQGDNVTFTDTGSNSPAINLTTLLTPGSVSVVAAQNYPFSGSGQLAGSMTLTKNGPGTLFLQTSNAYTGGTAVTNGTVEVDIAGGLGAGPVSLGANFLTVNIAGGLLPNAISGAGVINVTETSGASTVFGGSLSNFTGVLNLPASPGGSAKTAIVTGGVNLSSNATVNVANGGTFYLGGVTVPAVINVSGSGNSEGYGAIRADNSTVSGPVNLLGNASLGVFTGTGNFSGVIGDAGNGYGISMGSPGTLTLSGPNTYTGPTTITKGTVNVTGNESAATGGWLMPANTAPATVNFVAGATVVVGAANQVQVGSSPSNGTPNNQTLNDSGTVTNRGSLLVARGGYLNINTNGVWVQAGAMTVQPPAGSGYGATMSVTNGGTFTYTGTNPIVLAPSSGNGGYGTLMIGGATFITGQGFTNGVSPAGTTGAGQLIFANNGTLVLSANIPELTSGVNSNNLASILLNAGGGAINTAGFSTAITNNLGGAGGLTKLGAGTLTLGATNSGTGVTTVSAGSLLVNGTVTASTVLVQTNATLGGAGVMNAAVTVQAGGTLQAGDLNYSNAVTFGGGLTLGNNAGAVSYSRFRIATGGTVAATALNVNGTNLVNILDSGLPAGTNTLITYTSLGGTNGFTGFQLGPVSVASGLTAALLNTGSAVQLAVFPAAPVNTNAPMLTNSVSGTNFTLSWPADRLGWRLEVQTNHLAQGVSSNPLDWGTVSNSAATNNMLLPISPVLPAQFYRLVYP